MEALVLERDGPSSFTVNVRQVPIPSFEQYRNIYQRYHPHSTLVRLRVLASALNHRDVWCKYGLYPGVHRIQGPNILGADCCGIIDLMEDTCTHFKLGDCVMVNPVFAKGTDIREMAILGLDPLPGTVTEYIIVPLDRLTRVPEHLSPVEAAALPLAHLTAYRAVVTQGKVTASSRVLVTGIGGGVALAALQIAVALKAQVFVTSGQSEKLDAAKAMGANEGALYTDPTWPLQLLQWVPQGFDVVVDGAGGNAVSFFIQRLLKPGGKLISYGATLGGPSSERVFHLSPKQTWKLAPDVTALSLRQIEWIGSTAGNESEWKALLELIQKTRMKPKLAKVFSLSQAVEALNFLENGKQFGKVVISSMPNLNSKL